MSKNACNDGKQAWIYRFIYIENNARILDPTIPIAHETDLVIQGNK